MIVREDTECIVCDDGSIDSETKNVCAKENIQFIRNETSKGLIYSRNVLMSLAKGEFAISLDDDAHFITSDALESIKNHFEQHPASAVAAFRIYWGNEAPSNILTHEKEERVSGFVGCGHAWRIKHWRELPAYPAWFIFYGEEDFASHHIFQHQLEVWYTPQILVHHRVDVKNRKEQKDYRLRLRRSLRAGWYLMFLFYPFKLIPSRIGFSIITQIIKRTFKGDMKGTLAIIQAMIDTLIHIPKLLLQSSRYTSDQLKEYEMLPKTRIYWESSQFTNNN